MRVVLPAPGGACTQITGFERRGSSSRSNRRSRLYTRPNTGRVILANVCEGVAAEVRFHSFRDCAPETAREVGFFCFFLGSILDPFWAAVETLWDLVRELKP